MQRRKNGWNKSILTAILTETESFRSKSLRVRTTIHFYFCSLDLYCRHLISFHFFIAGTVFFVFDTVIFERCIFLFISHDWYLILLWPLNAIISHPNLILFSSYLLHLPFFVVIMYISQQCVWHFFHFWSNEKKNIEVWFYISPRYFHAQIYLWKWHQIGMKGE